MINYEKLISLASSKNIEGIEIVEVSSNSLSVSYYEGHVENNQISKITSLTVKGLVNGHLATYKVENLNTSEEEILNRLYANASAINSNEATELFAGSDKYELIEFTPSDYHNIDLNEKIEMLSNIEKKLFESDKRVVKVLDLQYEEEYSAKKIINSKGLNLSKENEYCYTGVYIVASENGETQSNFEVSVKKNFKELEIDKMIKDVVEKAVSKLGAKPIESGNYPVIIENGAMRDLLNCFEGNFSGEAAIKKVTPLTDKIGSQIYSDKITVLDLPLQEDAIMREPFDDQGVACYNKTIVENGKFLGFMHNLKTAKYFNTKSTGNGFGNGISGMNFQIKAGTKSKEELIASIDKGLLLTGFDGLHAGVNDISGDLSLKTYGYYIENGKIVKPVTLIVLTANFNDMMNHVVEVGSDLLNDFRRVKSPSILFDSLSISGN